MSFASPHYQSGMSVVGPKRDPYRLDDFEVARGDTRSRRVIAADMKQGALTKGGGLGRARLPDFACVGREPNYGKLKPPEHPLFERHWVVYERAIRYWCEPLGYSKVDDRTIMLVQTKYLERSMRNRCYMVLYVGK
eukprot:GEMP01072239.1.p1 GENE.GEMP01072239.1~~GEMP01072239.1.p1  ORF type:complete len:136 (-),score=6.56 GEMP01072239.1:119-526(-)